MILGGAEGSSGTGVVPLVGAISSIIEGGIDEIGAGIVAMGRFVLGDGCGGTTGLLGRIDGTWAMGRCVQGQPSVDEISRIKLLGVDERKRPKLTMVIQIDPSVVEIGI